MIKTQNRKAEYLADLALEGFKTLRDGRDVAVVLPDAASANALIDTVEAMGAYLDIKRRRARLPRRKGARCGALRTVVADRVAPKALAHFSGEIILAPGLGDKHDVLSWRRLGEIMAARLRVRAATRSGGLASTADLGVLKRRI
ncbi:hypothetical protein [Sulfitobacter sp. W074]|uniref:hypothetical protein n=1 Tax=Sulfitobacter sp. W074 TaxID=2867026 RepID=UPI0021A57F4C|nr:hypothetical protein [Sulfitobacter sp. W074]UWR36131.1 hypothetical protein K3762_09940 [Sulfitobacter sp. W074]